MESIGIFEAKTHFAGLCDKVAASGSSVTVSRRGRPLVVISPARPHREPGAKSDILSAWRQSVRKTPVRGEFPDVTKWRRDRPMQPLAE